MGVHIHVVRSIGGLDHPEWDYIRQANDREFAYRLLDLTPKEWREGESFAPDPAAMEASIDPSWDNAERYRHMAALVRQGNWVRLSF